MRLVHRPRGSREADERVLAATVDTADTFLSRARGLMFRREFPDGEGLAFRFGDTQRRAIHMLFVPFPLDVIWTVDGVVETATQLRPWTGLGRGRADAVYELPANTARDVEPGDLVELVP